MNLANKTIKEIALEMPAATRVFQELKIDYCCGGGKNFLEACEKAELSSEMVEKKISDALQESAGRSSNDFLQQVSASKLIDLIVQKHHIFTKNELARLTPLMEKVAGKHGEHYPYLIELKRLFIDLRDELLPHMQKEEFILFPHVKRLEASEIANISVPRPAFGTVTNPIRMMSVEHDSAGDILREIRRTTSNFTPPADACPSFKALYFGLEELEKDLHQHIHLENNVLFPMSLELENKSAVALA